MASVFVRQKLIALQKFEILYILLENELKWAYHRNFGPKNPSFLFYKFIWLFYKEKNNSRDFRHGIGSWIPLCMSSVRWPLGMKATRVVLFFSIYSFFLSESWKCVYKIKIRYALTCTGLTTIANRQEKWIGFVRTVTAGVITFSVTVLEHLPCTNFSHEP